MKSLWNSFVISCDLALLHVRSSPLVALVTVVDDAHGCELHTILRMCIAPLVTRRARVTNGNRELQTERWTHNGGTRFIFRLVPACRKVSTRSHMEVTYLR